MSISRVDHAPRRTFGYLVRVQRDRVLHQKFFSDYAAGGKRKAWVLARDFEAELIERLEANRRPMRPVPGRRNTSGIVGVSRTKMRNGKNLVGYWQAHWRDREGQRRSVKFSVEKFGEEKARKMASKARRAGMAEALAASA